MSLLVRSTRPQVTSKQIVACEVSLLVRSTKPQSTSEQIVVCVKYHYWCAARGHMTRANILMYVSCIATGVRHEATGRDCCVPSTSPQDTSEEIVVCVSCVATGARHEATGHEQINCCMCDVSLLVCSASEATEHERTNCCV